MNEQRNNGRGIFYGVIGVATLVVAIIGATFAYFTASASNNSVITGNMASINLSLAVEKVVKVDDAKNGMIPMSNGMVQSAATSDKGICVDDNGNAVCQVYKITITNDSSAGQFIDGYVSLQGGSAAPTDFDEYIDEAKFKVAEADTESVGTTMRWAQVFCTESENTVTACTTAGTQVLGADDPTTQEVTEGQVEMSALGDANNPKAESQILTVYDYVKGDDTGVDGGMLADTKISGSTYKTVGSNYIRVSNHDWTKVDSNGNQTYKREDDATSALVFNHNVGPNTAVSYYILVWLSETGTNQTPGVTNEGVTNPDALTFFNGNVTFVSAQGSEVSATFSGYSRVSSQTTPAQEPEEGQG